MASGLHWELKKREPDMELEVSGEIDENSNFDELAQQLKGPAVLDLKQISRINSTGVREWMNFVRAVEEGGGSLKLTGCSVAMVQQLNMISGFVGTASVLSIYAPYVCPECEATLERLIDLSSDVGTQVDTATSCPECSSEMEFDDLVDHYFSFLQSA